MQYEYWEDYEVLTVETPENLLLRLPLAGFGPRFLALVIDTLLLGVATMIVVGVIVILGIGAFASSINSSTTGMVLFILIIVIVSFVAMSGYYIVFETIWHGQTPGKRITGIRVIKRGGQPLEFRDVLLRNILRIVDNLPANYFAGLIFFFLTKHQQRLGDLVADTVVVREFSRQLPFTWAGSAPGQLPGDQLGPRLSYIIGSYLQRIRELPIEVRLELTDSLIRQIGYNPGPLSITERESYLAGIMRSAWGGSQ